MISYHLNLNEQSYTRPQIILALRGTGFELEHLSAMINKEIWDPTKDLPDLPKDLHQFVDKTTCNEHVTGHSLTQGYTQGMFMTETRDGVTVIVAVQSTYNERGKPIQAIAIRASGFIQVKEVRRIYKYARQQTLENKLIHSTATIYQQ